MGKVLTAFLALWIALPATALSCTCKAHSGDSTIRLLVLPLKPELVTLQGQTQSFPIGRKARRYSVSVVESSDARLYVHHILTGFGGGDCGIELEAGQEYSFLVWANAFLDSRYLTDCQLLGKSKSER